MLSLPSMLVLLMAAVLPVVNAIPTISAVGRKFFTSEGNQFYVKGIRCGMTRMDITQLTLNRHCVSAD